MLAVFFEHIKNDKPTTSVTFWYKWIPEMFIFVSETAQVDILIHLRSR